MALSEDILNDEIEKYEKRFSHVGHVKSIAYHFYHLRDKIIDGLNMIINSQAKIYSERPVWVKVSERLPDNRIDDMPIRFINCDELRYEIAYCDENGRWFYRNENDDSEYNHVGKIFEDRIEWLEEIKE